MQSVWCGVYVVLGWASPCSALLPSCLAHACCVACSEEARKAAGAAAKPPSLQFKRSAGRERPVTYELTDKVPAKGSADWKRVVAVIVMVGGCTVLCCGDKSPARGLLCAQVAS
jgi:hypothetical protein